LSKGHQEENVALKMTNSEVDGIAVVALVGRIVLGEESQALRQELKNLIAEGKKKIVLNMDNIAYIDSAGLGILVAAHVCAKVQGTSIKLSNLGRKFREVLQMTRLITVFEVCDTEAAAVASFSKPAHESAEEKPSVTLSGTVGRIIQPLHPSMPEKAEISVEGADELYQEIRIENALTDEHGDEVRLEKGAHVEVTVEAAPEATTAKSATP
jgi:anti-sigma B factor antagonist